MVHDASTAAAAAAMAIRLDGAEQLSRLLRPPSDGATARTALTSTGKLGRADRFQDYLMRMGSNGYWNQVTFGLRATATRRAGAADLHAPAGDRARAKTCASSGREDEQAAAGAGERAARAGATRRSIALD